MMDDLLDQYRERVKAELPPDLLRVQAGYHQAADRIRNSALKIDLTDYFVRNWMAKLGPHGTLLVIAFRALGLPSLHRGGGSTTVIIGRQDLVKITGLSLSTVKRTLQDPVFQEFIKPHERFAVDAKTGLRRQVENEYEVFFDDPLLPGDEQTLYREMIDEETRRRVSVALGLPQPLQTEGPTEPEPPVPSEPQPGVPTGPQGQGLTEPDLDAVRQLVKSRFSGPEPPLAGATRGVQASSSVAHPAPSSPATLNVHERSTENVLNVGNVRPTRGLGTSTSGPARPFPDRRDREAAKVDAFAWAELFIELTGDRKSERFYIGAARAYLEWDRARGWALLDEVYGTIKLAQQDGKLDKPGAAANGLLRKVARENGFAATRADKER